MLRGLILAFAMVVLRIVQGALINTWETRASGISLVLLACYIIVVLIWGFIDGRRDANAEPDPDRRADLAMTWLLAGLVAGFVAGVVSWLIYQFYKTMYVASLFNEITTFAAFTALLIFIFAMAGVAAGRFVVDRRYKKEGAPPSRRRGTRRFGLIAGACCVAAILAVIAVVVSRDRSAPAPTPEPAATARKEPTNAEPLPAISASKVRRKSDVPAGASSAKAKAK